MSQSSGWRRGLIQGAAALLFAAGAVWTSTASAAAYSSSSYVVSSRPLLSSATGQALWSYGYVQLWYDPVAGRNWSRVVFLLGGANETYARINRQAVSGGLGSATADYDDNNGSKAGYDSTGSYLLACGASLSVACSYEVYAPNNPATADGIVEAGGVEYLAEAGQ
jgi:hypothetical protein